MHVRYSGRCTSTSYPTAPPGLVPGEVSGTATALRRGYGRSPHLWPKADVVPALMLRHRHPAHPALELQIQAGAKQGDLA
jgi:hypothetical protein